MSKYIPDISSRRWVIISQQRVLRPEDYAQKTKRKKCPFCSGHEDMAPPEVLRFGSGEPNKPGWKVRVFPNKFPITDLHEVIVHSPDCEKDIKDLPVPQIELILKAYRERYNFYRKKGQVLIFNNHGEHAGASLKHPHSQLVVIPSQINLDALLREPLNNLVFDNKYFYVYCPDFSQWPYEVWITPKEEGKFYGDITDDQITDMAEITKRIFQQLARIYHQSHAFSMPFDYNYYIYPRENWYMRIIPRFVHRAGFELGTGLNVNIIDPLDAALQLKGIESRMVGVLSKLKKNLK